MLPLAGITVVALEQAVAAPFATRQLADLGARVIKIERPDGGDFARAYDTTVKGLSSYFVWLNRSKESLTLDVKRPEGRDVLERLLSRADVFVQNLAPGAVDRLAAAAADLRARYPRLIVCSISAYGASGPYGDKKGYDLLVQSEVGLLSVTGTEEVPCRVGISVADIAAGMYAYSAILTALLARRGHGRGTSIDISLFEALAEWMGPAIYATRYGGLTPPRTGPNHASIAPYGPFPSREREQIFLGIQNASGPGSAPTCCAAASWPRTSGFEPTRCASAIARRSTMPSTPCSPSCRPPRSSAVSIRRRLRTGG